MLVDRFQRSFKKGQTLMIEQEGMFDAKVVRLEEESIIANGQSAPVHKVVVEITFQAPIPPGATCCVPNMVIVKEPEAKLHVMGESN
jgi:hypothetical protein